jgi:hypothetical protein
MKNKTDITFVIDRSGSMMSVWNETITGFNHFIKTQKETEGEASLTLIQFDDKYEVNYVAKDIKTVPDLTGATYTPRGCTALLDAIGKAITTTGVRLNTMSQEARPDKVIFVILTDGAENASREYSKDAINKMITHQKEKYNWDFVFLGANQDAIATGASLGLSRGQTLTYDSTAKGTDRLFATLSTNMTAYRSGVIGSSASFISEEDRKAAGATK